MHASRFLLALCGAFIVLVSSDSYAEDSKQTLVIAGKKPDGPFTEQKPDYLHYREVVVTRTSSQSIKFDITLAGEIPTNLKESIGFYFGFDVDNDNSTGTVFSTGSNAGYDTGFSVYRMKNMSTFKAKSLSKTFKGRVREIDVTGLKVRGNKLELIARSELFRMFDSLRFYMVSQVDFYDKGQLVNQVDVDFIPSTQF
jgi:hypothetical protein